MTFGVQGVKGQVPAVDEKPVGTLRALLLLLFITSLEPRIE